MRLALCATRNPQLVTRNMADPKTSNTAAQVDRTARFRTADGVGICYGVWTSPLERVRGSVVVLNGRTEYLEKYTETIGDLNRRGFSVYSFDWRGQGLSDRMLPDRLKGYVQNYEGYLLDLEDFFDQIVRPNVAGPVILLAHSMGGHIALRFLHDHPTAVSRAVLTAPLIDIIPSPYPKWIVIILTRLAVKTGFTHAYVLGAKYRNPFDQAFQGNPLTSDPRRFGFDKQAITDSPDLALGEPTFGWVAATLDSIALLKQPGYAEGIKTPVMVVSAGKDRIVCCAAQKRICLRMPDCRLKVLDESLHEILMEADPIREQFWRLFDRFVD